MIRGFPPADGGTSETEPHLVELPLGTWGDEGAAVARRVGPADPLPAGTEAASKGYDETAGSQGGAIIGRAKSVKRHLLPDIFDNLVDEVERLLGAVDF